MAKAGSPKFRRLPCLHAIL